MAIIMCSVYFCSPACLVTLPHVNILSVYVHCPTQFIYSILDLSLKFRPCIDQIVVFICVIHMSTLMCYALCPMCYYSVYNCSVSQYALHTHIILNHQSHAYLETLKFLQLKRYAPSPRECVE